MLVSLLTVLATAVGGSPALAQSAMTGAGGCVRISGWTVRRLAAQTVIVPAEETDVSSVAWEIAHGAGGVILFGASAPANLGYRIGALRRKVPGHLGLLVMADEEGGGAQRMANLVGNLPWARDMGLNWTPTMIRRHVAAVAKKMAAAGVNTDLAPVVDVDGRNVPPGPTDPDGWRSFSGRTGVVSRDGLAYMRGLLNGGVIPVLKHFPGLGGASRNTDYGRAYTLPWSRLRRVGLPPFVAGIQAGAPAVMVSNAIVPGLTRLPASLSPAAIRGELVRQLQFHGLIVTDTLTSGAISQAGFHPPRAAVHAIRAGADMVMYTATTNHLAAHRFHEIVAKEVSAVHNGFLSRSRLVAAAGAVLTARHVSVC
jgi:beta-N-acetylhexosaminidase